MVKAIINTPNDFCNPLSKYSSNAANLSPSERKAISVQTLARSSTVTEIAARNNVSRKFAHQQKNIANQALEKAFNPIPKDDGLVEVDFKKCVITKLPPTKVGGFARVAED